jgi:uncharacterized membrane protein
LNNTSLEEEIINLLKFENPSTVAELVDALDANGFENREDAIKVIDRLEVEGKISLFSQIKAPTYIIDYLLSKEAAWSWLTIGTSIITFLSIMLAQTQPLLYIRQVLGFMSILFLPGFCLIKTLFPEKKIGKFETLVLSIGLSLALTPLLGMILNYTPWGLTTMSVTFSLLFLTILLAFIGIIREYNVIKSD